MADESKISWTDHTFNPWMGCMKVGEECRHCYADTLTSGRMGLDVFGARHKRQRTSTGLWKRPARWNRDSFHDFTYGDGLGRAHRVFCASLADLFEDAPGPNEWRDDVWAVIRSTPWLDWQLLTKRPERIVECLPDDWGRGWPNVWLGTSIGHRETVERARILGEIPAFNRFISYEPAIGPVIPEEIRNVCDPDHPEENGTYYRWQDDYTGPGLPFYNCDGELGFHWLIAGGESGPGHRPMKLEWAADARAACETEEVAFFFKQTSGARPGQGEDALGEVVQQFPRSWDRADLASHPVYADAASLIP
jgi:protein gp37